MELKQTLGSHFCGFNNSPPMLCRVSSLPSTWVWTFHSLCLWKLWGSHCVRRVRVILLVRVESHPGDSPELALAPLQWATRAPQYYYFRLHRFMFISKLLSSSEVISTKTEKINRYLYEFFLKAAKSKKWQNRNGKHRVPVSSPISHPPSPTVFPVINILYWCGAFLTTNVPIFIHTY